MQRVHDGAIGDIVAARCYWNQGGLWCADRQRGWSDMEWQIRNWLYFTWLSGDHICEQHIHNIDVAQLGQAGRTRCARYGLGGRQVRTDPQFGKIYDHHAVQFVYADELVPVQRVPPDRQLLELGVRAPGRNQGPRRHGHPVVDRFEAT